MGLEPAFDYKAYPVKRHCGCVRGMFCKYAARWNHWVQFEWHGGGRPPKPTVWCGRQDLTRRTTGAKPMPNLKVFWLTYVEGHEPRLTHQ